MPYEASFFDAMSGVKKLINFMYAINVIQFLQTAVGDRWSLASRSWVSDSGHEVCQLFDARHGVKKRCLIRHRVILALIIRCHVWHRFLTPYLASESLQIWSTQSLPCTMRQKKMPYLALFFDAMSGVKKLTNFMHSITCPTPAYEASYTLARSTPWIQFFVRIYWCICRSIIYENITKHDVWSYLFFFVGWRRGLWGAECSSSGN